MKGCKSVVISLFTIFCSIETPTAIAQSQESDFGCPITISEQLEEDSQRSAQSTQPDIVSANNPSQTKNTIPSLWWAVEQFDPLQGNLVTTWQANRTTKVIDIIVNQRSWLNLDYFNRYSFVHRMGNVARDYQYQLRVLNQQQDCLAIYFCDFDTKPSTCNLQFTEIIFG